MTRTVRYKDILIPEGRQRREHKSEHIVDLANSIMRSSLLHPPIVRVNEQGQMLLVGGECRMKAIDYLWNMGGKLRYANTEFAEGELPVSDIGELDPVDAYEAELEENIRRLDLSWQDRADATAKLFDLRSLQAKEGRRPVPTVASISAEVRGDSHGAQHTTRKELLVSRHLHDEDVAKAKSVDEAFKILKRKEELTRSAELAVQVGKTFSAADHTLLQGDCEGIMPNLPAESFDVILTDPPYGIGAQDFNDSGKLTSGTHFYDDSPEMFEKYAPDWLIHCYRVAKPQAHLYWFCDIQWFERLKGWATASGWKVFRTPIIWINPTAMRAPWPDQGPQRKWQMILYAVKGDKKCNRLAPDFIVFPSDKNLNHHAQKPVSLYSDLLRRSCRPGDSVIDPFCGSGPIFPAAHALKVRATGIELDPSAAGIAAARLKDLK